MSPPVTSPRPQTGAGVLAVFGALASQYLGASWAKQLFEIVGPAGMTALRVVLAAVLLWLAGLAPWLIFAFAMAQGAGIGLTSILRPVLIAEILGRQGFGAISGAVAVAPILASAAAPSVGAGLLAFGGPGLVYAVCLGLALTGLGLMAGLLARRESG